MGRYKYDYYGYRPYVSVAQRRAQALKELSKRIKNGQAVLPVRIEGRSIATTFWGKAWCNNLESYSDFANRLPRGRSYVRNGSVVHLQIDKGRIEALVSGSDVYTIQIDITAVPKHDWQALKAQSAGKIGTLVELLNGKLSKGVMELVTGREHGLFPKPNEIKMKCSCPDGAWMCKHIAAVMYGIGNRLDSSPALLFVLRGVDHLELIEQAIPAPALGTKGNAPTIAAEDLGAIFDIEIGDAPEVSSAFALPKLAAKKSTAAKKTGFTAKDGETGSEPPAAKRFAKKAAPAKQASAAKAAATVPEPPTTKRPAKRAPAVKQVQNAIDAALIARSPAAQRAAERAAAAKATSAARKAPPAKKASTTKVAPTVSEPPAAQRAAKKARPAKKALSESDVAFIAQWLAAKRAEEQQAALAKPTTTTKQAKAKPPRGKKG